MSLQMEYTADMSTMLANMQYSYLEDDLTIHQAGKYDKIVRMLLRGLHLLMWNNKM